MDLRKTKSFKNRKFQDEKTKCPKSEVEVLGDPIRPQHQRRTMTDLEPWELLAERVVGEMNTSAGLARHTPVTNGDGASISQVHHKHKRPGSAPGAGSQLCASENASDMAIEIEGDRLREDAPWERNNQDDMQSFDTLAGDALNRGAEEKPLKARGKAGTTRSRNCCRL